MTLAGYPVQNPSPAESSARNDDTGESGFSTAALHHPIMVGPLPVVEERGVVYDRIQGYQQELTTGGNQDSYYIKAKLDKDCKASRREQCHRPITHDGAKPGHDNQKF